VNDAEYDRLHDAFDALFPGKVHGWRDGKKGVIQVPAFREEGHIAEKQAMQILRDHLQDLLHGSCRDCETENVQSHRHRTSPLHFETYQCLRGDAMPARTAVPVAAAIRCMAFSLSNSSDLTAGEPKLFLSFPAPSPDARSQPGLSRGNGRPDGCNPSTNQPHPRLGRAARVIGGPRWAFNDRCGTYGLRSHRAFSGRSVPRQNDVCKHRDRR
jgi:hypothetical protein